MQLKGSINKEPGKCCRESPTSWGPKHRFLLYDSVALPSLSLSFICQVWKIIPLGQLPKGTAEIQNTKTTGQLPALQTEEAIIAHTQPRQDKSGLREGTKICPYKKRCLNRGRIDSSHWHSAAESCRVPGTISVSGLVILQDGLPDISSQVNHRSPRG